MEKNILLMDNSERFLRGQATLLEEAGYQVLEALSLEEAEEKLRREDIDLAILDIRMLDEEDEHDISGLLLAQKEEYWHIPKIILTAHPSEEYRKEAQTLKPDDLPPEVKFMSKGEGFKKLLITMEQIFNHRFMNR